jgi:hypothetical protein
MKTKLEITGGEKKSILTGAKMISCMGLYYGMFLVVQALVENKTITGQEAVSFVLTATAVLFFIALSFIFSLRIGPEALTTGRPTKSPEAPQLFPGCLGAFKRLAEALTIKQFKVRRRATTRLELGYGAVVFAAIAKRASGPEVFERIGDGPPISEKRFGTVGCARSMG